MDPTISVSFVLCGYQRLCESCLSQEKKLSFRADESLLQFIHIQGATPLGVAFSLSLSTSLIPRLARFIDLSAPIGQ
jgi:hypothetical protein